MIIWINGPFGVGKTQTANELNRRIPNSFIFDPENLGYFMRKNYPKQLHNEDFQDYEFWRKGNYELLLYLYNHFDGTIIVPMTLYKDNYFNEIVQALRKEKVEVHHFSLLASRETIHKRLNKRFDFDKSWALKSCNHILEKLKEKQYGIIIETTQLSIEEVAEVIAENCKIKLNSRENNIFKKISNRMMVQIKNIK